MSLTSEAALRSAIEGYYAAVDRGDWTYTYNHLDSKTRKMFTEEEWHRKNKRISEQTSFLGVDIDGKVSSTKPVEVTVYMPLPHDSCLVRNTYFIQEDGTWKHRFGEEEIDIFMPEVSYRQFAAAHQQGSLGGEASTTEERASVRSTVGGFYQAQAKGEFEKAYCYAGPALRDTHGSMESWVREQEQRNQVVDANINALRRVTIVSNEEATAYIDVTFEDNRVGTSRFTGTWTLVREHGQWKLNESDLH